MSDLQIDIVEMLGQGTHPATIASAKLNPNPSK
jgi:hypothetical protein